MRISVPLFKTGFVKASLIFFTSLPLFIFSGLLSLSQEGFTHQFWEMWDDKQPLRTSKFKLSQKIFQKVYISFFQGTWWPICGVNSVTDHTFFSISPRVRFSICKNVNDTTSVAHSTLSLCISQEASSEQKPG